MGGLRSQPLVAMVADPCPLWKNKQTMFMNECGGSSWKASWWARIGDNQLKSLKCRDLLSCDIVTRRIAIIQTKIWVSAWKRSVRMTAAIAGGFFLVFAFDGGFSVFTGSGVTSAKQTGHCCLNTGCHHLISALLLSLPLFMSAWLDIFIHNELLKYTSIGYFGFYCTCIFSYPAQIRRPRLHLYHVSFYLCLCCFILVTTTFCLVRSVMISAN